MLYWTARGVEVPVGFDDALDAWVDIDACERALGVDEATPILIDPVGRIDRRLARFFRRSRFAFEGMFLTPTQARALLRVPQFHVHDNPGAFLT